jgi:hypothetical protein
MKNVRLLKRGTDAREEFFPVGFTSGRVVGRDGGRFLLRTESGMVLRGRKAEGCLLEPETNDLVLVWNDGGEGAFIVNVLVKEEAEARLVLGGGVVMRSEAGTLALEAENLELVATRSARMVAPRVDLCGTRGSARFTSFSLLCRVAGAYAEKITAVADVLDSVAGRLTQRARDCFRWVERIDQTKAGSITHIAEGRFAVKAGNASLLADKDVKIDGEKIHLG